MSDVGEFSDAFDEMVPPKRKRHDIGINNLWIDDGTLQARPLPQAAHQGQGTMPEC